MGAKSKKDPTIWVCGAEGQEAAVDAALIDLTALFNIKGSRITLKIIIPSDHHFSVIGRKGCNVKQVG